LLLLWSERHWLILRRRTESVREPRRPATRTVVPLTLRNGTDNLMHSTRCEGLPKLILIQESPPRRAQTPFVVAACRP
jgi:hypothetical protein